MFSFGGSDEMVVFPFLFSQNVRLSFSLVEGLLPMLEEFFFYARERQGFLFRRDGSRVFLSIRDIRFSLTLKRNFFLMR